MEGPNKQINQSEEWDKRFVLNEEELQPFVAQTLAEIEKGVNVEDAISKAILKVDAAILNSGVLYAQIFAELVERGVIVEQE